MPAAPQIGCSTFNGGSREGHGRKSAPFQNKSAATDGETDAVYCVEAAQTGMGRFRYST